MASPEVLDFAQLLVPAPGPGPAGEDLRADSSPTSPYYAVRDARAAARTAEWQMLVGEEGAANGAPDWRPVLRLGLEALADKSKDLEVVAYVIEALVRLHGFAGLRDGFRLGRELVERYWEEMYPRPDEDGVAGRVAALAGLNGEGGDGALLAPIHRVALTEPTGAGTFCFADYRDAVALDKVTDAQAREARLARGAVPLDAVRRAVAETAPAFYQNLVEDLAQCQEQFGQLSAALGERCGPDAPPTSEVRAALQSCLDEVRALAGDKLLAAAAAAVQEQASEGAAPAGPATPPADGGDALRTREDAFRCLLRVAEFFRRTEPHAVLSYTLEQAVRWGRMPLPELLAELIPEESSRLALFKQVGIKPLESTPGA